MNGTITGEGLGEIDPVSPTYPDIGTDNLWSSIVPRPVRKRKEKNYEDVTLGSTQYRKKKNKYA